MLTTLTFAPATDADLDELNALVASAYRGDSARAGWTHEADLLGGQRTDRDGLADLLAAPDQTILTARQAGRLIGCVQVSDEDGGRAYLGMLSVEPALQGVGLGRALIDEAEAHARATLKATTMVMTVIAQRTELIAWYERRGYTNTGVTKPFPYGDVRFGEPKRDDLVFVVLEKPLA